MSRLLFLALLAVGGCTVVRYDPAQAAPPQIPGYELESITFRDGRKAITYVESQP